MLKPQSAGMLFDFLSTFKGWSKADCFLSVQEQEVQTRQLMSVAASLLYGIVALVMGFVNKVC